MTTRPRGKENYKKKKKKKKRQGGERGAKQARGAVPLGAPQRALRGFRVISRTAALRYQRCRDNVGSFRARKKKRERDSPPLPLVLFLRKDQRVTIETI